MQAILQSSSQRMTTSTIKRPRMLAGLLALPMLGLASASAGEPPSALDEVWLIDGQADAQAIGLNGPQASTGEYHELRVGDGASLQAHAILDALDAFELRPAHETGTDFDLWHLADVRLIEPAEYLGAVDLTRSVSVPPLHFERRAQYSALTRTLYVDFRLRHVSSGEALSTGADGRVARAAAVERLRSLATLELVAGGPMVLAEAD